MRKHLAKLQLRFEIQRETMKTFACNIEHESMRVYAYVRSKQKVQYKVSPLESSYGNIIAEGCLMAETLNA